MIDVAAAMERLDELVMKRREGDRYPGACALYEASLRGLLATPIPATVLYAWVLKWATFPEARGIREGLTRPV
jgi:hypothetical protein